MKAVVGGGGGGGEVGGRSKRDGLVKAVVVVRKEGGVGGEREPEGDDGLAARARRSLAIGTDPPERRYSEDT